MRHNQLNLFGGSRIDFNTQVQYTCDSLNLYGPQHDHWAVAWSWGKDSTTVLTLIVQLIESRQVQPPKSLTVLCSDTRLELQPLWIAAQGIIAKLREKGIDVRIVMAPLDDRFMVYMLGRGVPPPSNTFRWCTGQIKVEPMEAALRQLHGEIGQKILMITGVRQGESAIRDGRIAMSCSKDGAECGQGWYQTGLDGDMCSTLAPILHWRVCGVWDWLKVFAPMKEYGGWPTAILADAYGGDEAEEINARTGCMGCPLAAKDKALLAVVAMPQWAYLAPLLRLKQMYREMKKPQYRLRKDGERNKDGRLAKNQQRLGPLTLEARLYFLDQILTIQHDVNTAADRLGRPRIDILNAEEEARIRELITANTWPDGWSGTEVTGDIMLDKKYADGSVMPVLFRDMVGQREVTLGEYLEQQDQDARDFDAYSHADIEEQSIMKEFSVLGTWEEKLDRLIEIGKALSPLEEKYKTADRLIKGCHSKAWLHAEIRNGKVLFRADSDAIIVKGMAALLVRVLSGLPPEGVVNAELKFLEDIGLKNHLAPTRSNGLLAMIQQMKNEATQYLQQHPTP